MNRWGLVPAAVVGALVVSGMASAVADAATISKSGSTLSYTAAPGEVNVVSLSVDTGGHLILEDDGVASITIGQGSGCATSGSDNVLDCGVPTSGETVDISTGDGADSIDIGTQLPVASVTVDGGPGNDAINGGDGTETLLGGDGNDTITTNGGHDTIDAGNQDDLITAADGVADQITCGAGTDEIDADNIDTINDCEQDTTGTALTDPIATSLAASGLTTSGATLNANVNPQSQVTHFHFQWGTTTAYGSTTAATGLPTDPDNHSVSADLAGLNVNTTYHYRVVVTSDDAPTVVGDDQTFTTASLPAPTATTAGAPSSLSYNAATLNGTANGQGLAASYVYEWGKTTSYGNVTASASVPDDGADHATPADITGLSPSTTYHYQLIGTSDAGTTLGGDRSFTTPSQPQGPIEAIQSVRQVADARGDGDGVLLTIDGVINGNNLPVTYHVAYGPTTAYGSRTADQTLSASQAESSVSIRIPGVQGDHEEHLQLVATNSQGTTSSADHELTTENGFGAPACQFDQPQDVLSGQAAGQPVFCVEVTSVTTTTASIRLRTGGFDANESAVLSYGLTTAYGHTVSASWATAYTAVTLTKLSPGTIYHGEAVLRDFGGARTTHDFIFITSPASAATSATVMLSQGAATENVSCATANDCAGSVTIETVPLASVAAAAKKPKKPAVLATGSFNIGGHRTGQVRLRLTKAGKALLEHKHSLRVQQITTAKAHGHTATTVKTITLHVH